MPAQDKLSLITIPLSRAEQNAETTDLQSAGFFRLKTTVSE